MARSRGRPSARFVAAYIRSAIGTAEALEVAIGRGTARTFWPEKQGICSQISTADLLHDLHSAEGVVRWAGVWLAGICECCRNGQQDEEDEVLHIELMGNQWPGVVRRSAWLFE
jgi:hypothetical protein